MLKHMSINIFPYAWVLIGIIYEKDKSVVIATKL